MNEREWLSRKEAAAVLGIAVRSIGNYVKDRRLPARRIVGSRLIRIHRDDVKRLLEPRVIPVDTPARQGQAGAVSRGALLTLQAAPGNSRPAGSAGCTHTNAHAPRANAGRNRSEVTP